MGAKQATGKRRQKVRQACSNCQRSHLTCDVGRPCKRCQIRGLSDTCVDGKRKRAKYLGADDPSPPPTLNILPTNITESKVDQALPTMPVAQDTADFLSATADLEYSTIPSVINYNPQASQSPEHFGYIPPDTVDLTNLLSLPVDGPSNSQSTLATAMPPLSMQRNAWQQPKDVYLNVMNPYPYTPGFRRLLQYVKGRFDQEKFMTILRSMAKIRPSVIACTHTLTHEDLVFMEKSFQRMILEYERYFVATGTPTVVWRRTGEIASAGHEFVSLTGWSQEQLLQMFIIQLMDNESAVHYFELFADMAFGDSRGALMSMCTLVTPDGLSVRTSSVLTLRRDLFGIPMMIIGNFLPIL